MNTKLWIVALGLLLLWTSPSLADDARWMRYPAISPDAERIAFSYRGDIWIVDATGGRASMVTSHAGYERSPVWSPDGSKIAFAADWHGNMDVFVVDAGGGQATRLTYHSSGDTPTAFTPDGESVLFSSRRQDAPEASIGTSGMGEVYAIPLSGGRPRQIMTTTGEYANFDPAGQRLVFHDYKGFEDAWRKHHTSSVTRDVWMFDTESRQYTKLTSFPGEDRNPVWSPDGKLVYYLSQQGGTFNVWQLDPMDLEAGAVQVTRHETHPVRFLSCADNGTMCYGWNGTIWTRGDGESRQVQIDVNAGARQNSARLETLRDGATEMAVSPDEEEVAFVVRGEIFVANVEFGTTKRVTDTPEQERSVTWGADGRTLYYAGERDQSWNIYSARIAKDDESGFANATVISEESVIVDDDETFQPLCSPDGKQLAYLRNRTELMVMDLDTRKSSTLIPAQRNFSYTDGDIQYDWSPDSRYLVATYHGHESWISEIACVNVATGEIVNVTDSGYAESGPNFVSNGNAILYVSDRYGERSHGSWGGEYDVLALYVNQAAFDEAILDKEELALKKKREKDNGDKKKPEDNDASDDSDDEGSDEEEKDESDDEKIEPVKFEAENLDLRRRRLTLHSSQLASYDLSPDGETLIYVSQVDDKWALWVCQVRDRSTSNVLSLGNDGGGQVQFAKDGKHAFLMRGDGKISKVDLSAALKGGGKATAEPVAYAAEMIIDEAGEREYIFEHSWRQVKRKFYVEDLHGVDWKAMKENYAAFLPTLSNNHDFAELLSEMLGELNASHTGCRYRPRNPGGDQTASLGLLYDVNHEGVGLKVSEVIAQGPCDNANCKIRPGVVITHLDGQRLTADINPWQLLNRKNDKPVRLGLHHPDSEESWEEVVRPFTTGEENNLLYERWIANCRKRCEELSDGTIGYVHVRGMNDASFRRVYSEVLGINNEKQALIVDTRFNGGGWLHEDLATFLSGKTYCQFAPRGHEQGGLGGEPINKWTKPVVVLQSESNYSDAHFFPWAFREKGVGKLIGSPVPGTATAVWWERQINPALVFGIPQVGMITNDGEYLENNQLEPDVLVINDPESVAAGEDKQLAKAVEVLLSELK